VPWFDFTPDLTRRRQRRSPNSAWPHENSLGQESVSRKIPSTRTPYRSYSSYFALENGNRKTGNSFGDLLAAYAELVVEMPETDFTHLKLSHVSRSAHIRAVAIGMSLPYRRTRRERSAP
jgi:hypothetical protein